MIEEHALTFDLDGAIGNVIKFFKQYPDVSGTQVVTLIDLGNTDVA